MIFKNALIIDGTKDPKYYADILVEDGFISKIGKIDIDDKQIIDCSGKVVTPGFFDIHTHYDAELLGTANLIASTKAGVSHIVVGNCGVGVWPINDNNLSIVIDLLEGVEDIPKDISTRCMPNQFKTFKDYLTHIRSKTSVQVDSFLGYSCVRSYVLGSNSQNVSYVLSDDEFHKISEIIEHALIDGALGVSLSKSKSHKSINGDINPSYYTTDKEFDLICRICSKYKCTIQMVSDLHNPIDDLEKLYTQAKKFNVKILLSMQMHNSTEVKDSLFVKWQDLWSDVLHVQVHARPNAIFYGVDLPYNIDKLKLADCSKIYPIFEDFNYCPSKEKSILALANSNQISVDDYIDSLINRYPSILFYKPNFNFNNNSLDGVKLMLKDDRTLFGLSDAGAHQAKMLDAALALWMIQNYKNEISIEHLVYKATNCNTKFFNTSASHIIKVGERLDLNLIDFDNLSIGLPYKNKTPYMHLEQKIVGLKYYGHTAFDKSN